MLFSEGDSGTDMFVIGAGRVELQKRIGGVDKTIAVLGPGEMLGELALLNDKPRTATAIVLEELQAFVIDKGALEEMLGNNPEFTMRLIRRLSDRLDTADGLIQLLMHADPKAREMVLKQAEAAKNTVLSVEMDVLGEAATNPARVRDLFGRLNRLRARLREATPDGDPEEMPRPFVVSRSSKKPDT